LEPLEQWENENCLRPDRNFKFQICAANPLLRISIFVPTGHAEHKILM